MILLTHPLQVKVFEAIKIHQSNNFIEIKKINYLLLVQCTNIYLCVINYFLTEKTINLSYFR